MKLTNEPLNPSPEEIQPEAAVPAEGLEEKPSAETSTAEDEIEEAESADEAAEVTSREAALSQMPRIVEALLFASDEPLTLQKLKSILPYKPDVRKIKSAIDDINKRLREENHPFEAVEIGGGYQFRTVQYYHHWLKQLFKEKLARRLSQSALETLAIIAYKQPLTRAEIETIRGVVADGAMKTLLERRLIMIAGRSEKPGRPLLYTTTKDFLKYFGLSHLDDLPKLEEFEQLARSQDDTILDEGQEVPLPDEHIQEINDAQRIDAEPETEAAAGDERHPETLESDLEQSAEEPEEIPKDSPDPQAPKE